MQTGSLINSLYMNSKYPKPEVGMGATELCWTDRRAYTIIQVMSPKKIRVQRDNAVRVDQNGISESQQYDYTLNPDSIPFIVTLRKNGRWIKAGDSLNSTCFAIGYRDEYYDYSF